MIFRLSYLEGKAEESAANHQLLAIYMNYLVREMENNASKLVDYRNSLQPIMSQVFLSTVSCLDSQVTYLM